MYVYQNGTPQMHAYSMAQRYGLQMGPADLPGLPADRLSIQTYTSTTMQAPESGFRQMFRKAADFFSSFSSIASLAAIFFPPAAPIAAAVSTAAPAVDMVIAGMNQRPPEMMAMQTSSRYMPNFR